MKVIWQEYFWISLTEGKWSRTPCQNGLWFCLSSLMSLRDCETHWDPVQEGAERHNSLLLPSFNARVWPKLSTRVAFPRACVHLHEDSAWAPTIAFSICVCNLLPIFLSPKVGILGHGHAGMLTWSTEDKVISLSLSFLLASLLLESGNFPWSQSHDVSGRGFPVYSFPHWSGNRGEERRKERSKDKFKGVISSFLFPQPLQKKGTSK